jgi:CheY-like chemotaxis protein
VRLPLVGRAADEPASAVELHADSGGRIARRVLIVDDNEDAAQMLQLLIENLGSQVRTAADGAEAIEIAPDFLPEIVFLDLGMPRMNGYDAARRLRRQSCGKDMVLVALTGWGEEKDRQRIRQAGFDHHLVKPANLEQLRELLTGLKQRTPR